MSLDRVLLNGLVLILFYIIYQPFFLNFVPFLNYDSFLYFLVVDAWQNNLQLLDLIKLDLPIGYSYFLFFCESVGFGKPVITFIQIILFVIPFILLVNAIFSKNKTISLVVVVSSFIFFMSYDWIVHSVTFKPDFLFSTLLLWISYLVFVTKSWTTNRIVILGILIAVGVSLRSNGLLLVLFYILPLIDRGKHFLVKFKKIFFTGLVIQSFFVLISIVSVGYPAHGSLFRLYQTFTNNEIQEKREIVRENRLSITNKYLNPIVVRETNFYNTEIVNWLNVIYNENGWQGSPLLMHSYNGQNYFPESTIKLSFGEEFLLENIDENLIEEKTFYLSWDNTQNLPIIHKLAIQLQKFQRLFYPFFKFTFYFLIVLFIAFLLFNRMLFKVSVGNDINFLWLILFHFVSIAFLIYFHPRFVMRYALPTETILFIFSPLIIFTLINHFKCLKTKQ